MIEEIKYTTMLSYKESKLNIGSLVVSFNKLQDLQSETEIKAMDAYRWLCEAIEFEHPEIDFITRDKDMITMYSNGMYIDQRGEYKNEYDALLEFMSIFKGLLPSYLLIKPKK